MASESIINDTGALLERASTIREAIRKICDAQHDFAREAENLYFVLCRLQHEVTRDNSPLNRLDDTRRYELKKFSDGCMRNLDESHDFLKRCKDYHDYQTSILQTNNKVPLSDTDQAVLNKIKDDYIYYAFHISQLTVKASMESAGEAKDEIKKASFTLRFAVDTIAARFLATNEVSISTLAAHPRGDFLLWEEVSHALRQEGISDSILKKHRNPILSYIKAIASRTAFERIHEPPLDIGAAQQGPSRTSDHDSQSSKYHDDSEDLSEKLSRKRTRSNEESSRQTRRDSRTEGFQSRPSIPQNPKTGFRFSDPLQVFQNFIEKETQETLLHFLREKPTQPPTMRDEVRKIYQAYSEKYETRCESLLSRRSSLDRKKDVKAYDGLIDEIERQVIYKLDGLQLGDDLALRGLRKKIIDKVKKVLKELEEAKERLELG